MSGVTTDATGTGGGAVCGQPTQKARINTEKVKIVRIAKCLKKWIVDDVQLSGRTF
jgi:hypothetical protein